MSGGSNLPKKTATKQRRKETDGDLVIGRRRLVQRRRDDERRLWSTTSRSEAGFEENHTAIAAEALRLSDTKGDRWKLLRQQRTGSRIHRSITRETSRPLSPKGSSLTVTS